MHTLTKAAAGLVSVAAMTLGLVPPAHAAPGSTTVSPAGDHVSASLPPGGTISVAIGDSTGSCTTSTSNPGGANSKNRIPTSGNPNPAGPVTIKINPPVTSGCDDGLPGTTVTVSTSGNWKVALQNRPSSVRATLTIPQAGAVVHISGLANCTGTVAPAGSARVVGTFTNGSPSSLSFNSVGVPITVTGGGFCPTDVTEAFLTVTYEVKDVDNPGANVTVTA